MLRNIQIAKARCRFDDAHHAPAFHNDLSAKLVSRVNNLLYTIHIGCKGSNDDTGILVLLKQGIKGLSHCLLRRRKARTLCIRGITHQCQHTLFADFGKALQVNGISEYRCIIHLEIPGMDNNSCRRINGQCCRINNAVIRLNEFNPEMSENNGLSELHNLTFRSS